MIARIVPSARVVAHATAAVLIFGVLTVLVGLAAARFYGNAPVVTTADSKRASSETAPRLPAAWADPAQRGRVEALIAAGGHLFAAGPGLGVYRSTDESAWRPFHRGLETDMDILALALTPDGLFAGSRSGRLYRFADDAWRLVATFGDGPIRAICFFGAGYVVADEANIWTMKADARPERTPRGDAPWYFLTDRKVRTAREPTGLWTRAGEGAFVSGLTGETITAIGGAPGASACAVPGSPDDTGAALWRSDRATTRPVTAATLATDGDGAVSVLAAAEDVGIIATRLTDGASESVREGLPLVRVTALATLGDALYVATAGQGVFRRPHPAARAFEPFNNGLLFLAP